MQMTKFKLVLAAAIAITAGQTLSAQSNDTIRDRRELRQDHRELRGDHREVAGDKHELRSDRKEVVTDRVDERKDARALRAARVAHDTAAAKSIRKDMRGDVRETRSDVREAHSDRRELR